MSVSYPKLINFREDFFLRCKAKRIIFREIIFYHYFHESTSLKIFAKNDLSRTEKRKKFPYFYEVLKFLEYSLFQVIVAVI